MNLARVSPDQCPRLRTPLLLRRLLWLPIAAACITGCAGLASPTLPDSWPGDILAYPESRILQVSQSEAGAGLVFETRDPAVDVAEFYRGTLGYAGWSVEPAIATPDGALSVSADHAKSGRAILLVLTGLADGTRGELVMATGALADTSGAARRERRRR